MKGRTSSRKRPAFGAILWTSRKRCGLTQDQLALKLGVTRSNVRYYERDAKNPKVSLVVKCASALGVPVGAFLGDMDRGGTAKDHPVNALNHFYWSMLELEPKRLAFVVRLFSRQLAELRKERE